MRSLSLLLTLCTLAATTLAAVRPLLPIQKHEGPTTGRLIFRLRDGAPKTEIIRQAAQGGEVTHDWDIINGFAGNLNQQTIDSLRANANVESISEDGIFYAFATQTNATWGPSRISSNDRLQNQNPSATDFKYTYPDSAGEGVAVYIIDTGINTEHIEFGGRAKWGTTIGGYENKDGNGHGTHCAGTVAGSTYGVAKLAKVIAVKVLSDEGKGANSDVISGIDYAVKDRSEGDKKVISMSLGGVGLDKSTDDAVIAAIAKGVHVVVAAGNDGIPVFAHSLTTPARVEQAITVGATDIADKRAYFSNWGPIVDVFAPGVDIISAWIGSNTATNKISGTSMATPHVAGVLAAMISRDGNGTPAEMQKKLKGECLKDKLNLDVAAPLSNNLLVHLRT